MPDSNVVEVPLLDMFQNLTKQIDTLDRRLAEALDKLTRQIAQDHGALVGRVEALDAWRIRHEAGEGHPAVVVEQRSADKRLDQLEQEARDARAREADRERREGRRFAALGVLLTAAMALAGFLAVFLPLVQHR